jgi:hypothetical protein
MGRHSAPDDDEPGGAVVAASEADLAAVERRGRHSRGEDTADTGPLPGVPMRDEEQRAAVQDDRPTELLSLAEIEAHAEPAKPAKGNTSTAADLALIRSHPDVRNRVLGAVLAPFVLFVVVLLILSAKGVQYLLWIWIPLVSAGVLGGLILDRAHKEHAGG